MILTSGQGHMIEAEYPSRYYGILADSNQKWHLFLAFTTMIISFVAATVLLISLPVVIPSLLFLAIAGLTAYMFIYDHSCRAQVARGVSVQAREIYVDLSQLKHSDDGNILERAQELERRLDAATRVDIVMDNKLSRQTFEDAKAFVESKT